MVFSLARSRGGSAADSTRADAVNTEGVAVLLAVAADRASPPRVVHLGTALEGRRRGVRGVEARGTTSASPRPRTGRCR